MRPDELLERVNVAAVYRAAFRDWETRVSMDSHDPRCDPDTVFTFSVERTLDGDRQIIAEGVSYAMATAIEGTIGTLEALLAEVAGEMAQ